MSEDIEKIREALLHICSAIADVSLIVSNIQDRQHVIDMELSKAINNLQERISEIEKRTGIWR